MHEIRDAAIIAVCLAAGLALALWAQAGANQAAAAIVERLP